MGFAGWDCPKEHKYRKPRKGFSTQKDFQKEQLIIGGRKRLLKASHKLSERRLKKIRQLKVRKLIREIGLVFLITLPFVIWGTYSFISSYGKLETHWDKDFLKDNYEMENRSYFIRGYEALYHKDYEEAIYFFKLMGEYELLGGQSKPALLGIYLELCSESKTACAEAEKILSEYREINEAWEIWVKEITLEYNRENIRLLKEKGLIHDVYAYD